MIIVDETAVIKPGAVIGEGSEIGPYCLIGGRVRLGKNNHLHSHAVIEGDTTLGDNNEILPFVSLGHHPQDLKFHGESSRVVIGNNNTFREGVTVHKGTEGGGMLTKIGDDCLLMAGSHVAHDCQIGNHVIAANNVAIGGHVVIEDYVILGGNSALHQFTRVGQHALISGVLGVDKDVLPYTVVTAGQQNRICTMGINIIGLKRRGFDDQEIRGLLKFYHNILENDEKTLLQKITSGKRSYRHNSLVMNMIAFIQDRKKRPICLPPKSKN